MIRVGILFGLLVCSPNGAGAVEVAFLEIELPGKGVLQLEPGGKFAHIAISYRDGWLHSHPRTGVAWTRMIERFGRVSVVLAHPELPDPTPQQAANYLGRPYDRHYSWTDERIYCSELVAKLLHIPPEPMLFDAPVWSRRRPSIEARYGLSPDDLFRILSQSQGWKQKCPQGTLGAFRDYIKDVN